MLKLTLEYDAVFVFIEPYRTIQASRNGTRILKLKITILLTNRISLVSPIFTTTIVPLLYILFEVLEVAGDFPLNDIQLS